MRNTIILWLATALVCTLIILGGLLFFLWKPVRTDDGHADVLSKPPYEIHVNADVHSQTPSKVQKQTQVSSTANTESQVGKIPNESEAKSPNESKEVETEKNSLRSYSPQQYKLEKVLYKKFHPEQQKILKKRWEIADGWKPKLGYWVKNGEGKVTADLSLFGNKLQDREQKIRSALGHPNNEAQFLKNYTLGMWFDDKNIEILKFQNGNSYAPMFASQVTRRLHVARNWDHGHTVGGCYWQYKHKDKDKHLIYITPSKEALEVPTLLEMLELPEFNEND